MFKALVIIIISVLFNSAFAAAPCKVYGISDSPQKLHCTFPDRHILLSCLNGKYFLNRAPVTMAFHLEVESGTVPLVFKAPDLTLTVMMDKPIQAELQVEKADIPGTCTHTP